MLGCLDRRIACLALSSTLYYNQFSSVLWGNLERFRKAQLSGYLFFSDRCYGFIAFINTNRKSYLSVLWVLNHGVDFADLGIYPVLNNMIENKKILYFYPENCL